VTRGARLAALGLACACATSFAARAAEGSSGATPRPARPAARAEYLGAWLLEARTRVRAAPVVDEEVATDAELVVREGKEEGLLLLDARAEGYGCVVEARIAGDGTLELRSGQRCPVDLDEPDARGSVEARLRAGRGRLRDGALELELDLELSGSVSARVDGGTVSVMGREIVIPDTWAPSLPLRGSAEVRGVGRRRPR
jgi:hypothetical protein